MSENMSDKWVDYAVRIQSIAQAGLAYCEDKYGRERYEELRKISAEMISAKTDIPLEKVYDLFCNESGYQTHRSSIPEGLSLLTGRYCLCVKTTERGRSPEDGAMSICRLQRIQKKRCWRKRGFRYTAKS